MGEGAVRPWGFLSLMTRISWTLLLLEQVLQAGRRAVGRRRPFGRLGGVAGRCSIGGCSRPLGGRGWGFRGRVPGRAQGCIRSRHARCRGLGPWTVWLWPVMLGSSGRGGVDLCWLRGGLGV